MRLDQYLVSKGIIKSRHRSQIEIKAGRILVNGNRVKPSYIVKDTDNIEVLKSYNPYVSQGGLKLAHAIEYFNVDFTNTTIIDIGASTGGFTDCALKHGAKKVIAIDVGSDQMDQSLRDNSGVLSLEKTNYLEVSLDDFTPVDYVVMDVSFTSGIPLVFHTFETLDIPMIWLIKPQFETMKTPKSGVIKDPKLHRMVLSSIEKTLNQNQLYIQKITSSPIKGQKGNIEFLALIGRTRSYINIDAIVHQAHLE